MKIERMADSAITVTAIAEAWRVNNIGSVYWNNTRIHHYFVGVLGTVIGVGLKIFAGKKYDALADYLIGGGGAAVIHDLPDLKNDLKNKQSIFKLLR